MTLRLRVSWLWRSRAKKRSIQMQKDTRQGGLIPSRLLQQKKGEGGGCEEKYVCKTGNVAERRGAGTAASLILSQKGRLTGRPNDHSSWGWFPWRWRWNDAGRLLIVQEAVNTAREGGCTRQVKDQICAVQTNSWIFIHLFKCYWVPGNRRCFSNKASEECFRKNELDLFTSMSAFKLQIVNISCSM